MTFPPVRRPPHLMFALPIAVLSCAAIAIPQAPITQTAHAQTDLDCTNPITQTEMNICAAREVEDADDRLNALYGQLIPTLSETGETFIIEAQLAWIDYRDAECEFSASAYLGGSIAPLIAANCLQNLTELRADEMKGYLGDRPSPILSYDRATIERQEQRFFDALEAELFDHEIDHEMRLDLLQTAEAAWETYRDAACEFESLQWHRLGLEDCQIRLTAQRLDRLTDHLLLPY